MTRGGRLVWRHFVMYKFAGHACWFAEYVSEKSFTVHIWAAAHSVRVFAVYYCRWTWVRATTRRWWAFSATTCRREHRHRRHIHRLTSPPLTCPPSFLRQEVTTILRLHRLTSQRFVLRLINRRFYQSILTFIVNSIIYGSSPSCGQSRK